MNAFHAFCQKRWRTSGHRGDIARSRRWNATSMKRRGTGVPTGRASWSGPPTTTSPWAATRWSSRPPAPPRAPWAPAPAAPATSAAPARCTTRSRPNSPRCTASRPALLFTSGFVSNQAALSTILNSLPNGPGATLAGVLRRQQPRLDDRRDQGLARASARSTGTTTWRIWRRCCAPRPPAAPKLIAFESVYSMDADIAPIGAICDLAAAVWRDDLPRRGARGRHVWPERRRRQRARRRGAPASTSSRARWRRRSAATAATSPATPR